MKRQAINEIRRSRDTSKTGYLIDYMGSLYQVVRLAWFAVIMVKTSFMYIIFRMEVYE